MNELGKETSVSTGDLSVDEAVALISTETRLSVQDARDLLACSDDERALLIQTYKNAGTMPTASSWDKVFAILGVCAEVAGIVVPMTGAVQAIYSLGKTISGGSSSG